MFLRALRLSAVLLALVAAELLARDRPSSCSACPVWNMSQEPFRIFGNTYYVGTRGLGSILITSPTGDVLIDGALPESVPQIADHIRALGFRLEDVKLIVNTHVHFDHAGGIAELQKLSGGRVAASQWTAAVMRQGVVPKDDPQYGVIRGIQKVGRVEVIKDNQTLTAGTLEVTGHLTPGHTPGGTSWTWRSCENGRCLNLVYADSLTAVSADGFLFTHREEYPNGPADFERSFDFLKSTPCDILLTPHPDFSNLWQRLAGHNFVEPGACNSLAESSRESLRKRIATENGH